MSRGQRKSDTELKINRLCFHGEKYHPIARLCLQQLLNNIFSFALGYTKSALMGVKKLPK